VIGPLAPDCYAPRQRLQSENRFSFVSPGAICAGIPQISQAFTVRDLWAAKAISNGCIMFYRSLILAIAISMTSFGAQAFDDANYPNLKGRWNRFIMHGLPPNPAAPFDQTKPPGLGQQAPLTPEYMAIMEANLAQQAAGSPGDFTGASCIHGMPMMMGAFYPIELVVTPDTTYILVNYADHGRRIYTDGREWPAEIEPTYQGYSIGRWVDEDGDGRYDMLEVETRGPFKGPRFYDATGLPLHRDNQSIFKERIRLDKTDPNLLHDEITIIDHALTQPWTVNKRYIRSNDPRPTWPEFLCSEQNAEVKVGGEHYILSAGGLLMPATKDQPPPDLRYFKRSQK
jgi:hypothetical protein